MPDTPPFSVELIAVSLLRAVQEAEVALARAGGSGAGYTIADFECEVAGFVGLAGPNIAFIPAGSVANERAETMSTLRLHFSRTPAGLGAPL